MKSYPVIQGFFDKIHDIFGSRNLNPLTKQFYTHGIPKGPTWNFWCFQPQPSHLPKVAKRRLEVPNPDAEVLLEIWSSDVTGDELMSSVPGIYKIGFFGFKTGWCFWKELPGFGEWTWFMEWE